MDDRNSSWDRISASVAALRLSFRARLIAAVLLITFVALGVAFAAVYLAVSSSERGQLDASLLLEAHEEAREAARVGGSALVIGEGAGPVADDIGPLTKYAVVYDEGGEVLDATETFGGAPPPLTALPEAVGEPFDTAFGAEPLRAVVVDVPQANGARLLLAAPRTHLERDERFLWKTLLWVLVGAVVWASLLATGVLLRLTRHHKAIADVAQRVAGGDLSARVPTEGAAGETGRMVLDVNEMITRLQSLVTSQARFIAYASHELRSPLTVLDGELSLALRAPRENAEYRAAIQAALDSTRHLKHLAEDLLTLARVANSYRDSTAEISARELLEGAVEHALRARQAPPQAVRADLAEGWVRGNFRDLRRLFSNLLDNALRYTSEGQQVQVRARFQAERLLVWIADEGPGIPEADRTRVFEPFYRGPHDQASDAAGAGLGLAIVQQIAHAHGGSARALGSHERDPSLAGRGACLLVELPRARPG